MARSAFTMRPALAAVGILLLLSALACGLGGGAPAGSDSSKLVIENDSNFGSGPLDFTDMSAGLGDLTTYTVALTMTFDGTRDAKPYKWSKTYTLLADNKSSARQWTIERAGDAQPGSHDFLAEF